MAGKKPKKRVKKGVKKRIKKRVTKKKVVKRRLPKRRATKEAKKRIAKKKIKQKPPIEKPQGDIVGIVTHYFPKVKAAAIKLKAPLNLGDSIRIKGHTTDFTQGINSLQIDRQPINQAKRGQEIGLLVVSRVRRHDTVYKV